MMSNDSECGSRGPCLGCGEKNYTAHDVSICAACLGIVRLSRCHRTGCKRTPEICGEHANEQASEAVRVSQEGRRKGDVPHLITVSLTPFEAAMVLCVLAVAKGGESQFDTPKVPIRRLALESAYKRLSHEMCVPAMNESAK